MRTVDEYVKLPYKMEIVPDTEEGDMWYLFLICQGVHPWEIL